MNLFATTPSRKALRLRAAERRRQLRARRWGGPGFSLSGVVAVIAALLAGQGTALANPTGGQVVAGSATLNQKGPDTLDIHQSTHKAIINWQSFSVGAGQKVNFLQPGRGSVTLNRVLGNDPSAIFGQISAPGTVMLVNPNGVVFGPGSRVDVGGLVASTANLRDEDFLAGRYAFTQASPRADAAIVNQGTISIRDSGLAALVAPRVRNAGVIEARLGQVALGAAQTFTLDFHGDGLLSFDAGSAVQGALLEHSGRIQADGGSVLLTARAVKGVVDNVINTSGIVSAQSVGTQAGRIVLSGGEAGGVAVGGALDAAGRAAGEQGGRIVVNGQDVHLAAGAQLDASGAAGGGEVAVGSAGVASGYADKARSVTMEAGAAIRADALDDGRGGHATLWSDQSTTFAGDISVRGGARGGDGGFVEVSSHQNIGLSGQVDARADKGKTGDFLIDPATIRITDSSSSSNTTVSNNNTVTRGWLEGQSGSANLTLEATGQITIDAMAGQLINLATTAGHQFTLRSTQSDGIRFADAATEIRTAGGSIRLEAIGIDSTLANVGKLSTQGGGVTLLATRDVQLAGAVNAGAGTVSAQSLVGSVVNQAGSSPLVTGGQVEFRAAAGHVGAAGGALQSATTRLVVESGGNIVVGNAGTLTSLSLATTHSAGGAPFSYLLSSTGLTFEATDAITTGGATQLGRVQQAGALDFSFSADRSVALGALDVGGGAMSLTSTGGDLLAAAGGSLKAGTLALTAQGSTLTNGAIGSGASPLQTDVARLSATAGSGGVAVANASALVVDKLNATGASSVTAAGDLTAGRIATGNAALALTSQAGQVLDDGDATTRADAGAGTLTVQAATGIGSPGAAFDFNAGTLTAQTAQGDIAASARGSVNADVRTGDGAITLASAGALAATRAATGTSRVGNDITLSAQDNLSAGEVDAGTLGNVSLSSTAGSVQGASGTGRIVADQLTLSAATGIGNGTALRTAVRTVSASTAAGALQIAQNGDLVATSLLAGASQSVAVDVVGGQLQVGSVGASSGSLSSASLTAQGAIVDDGQAGTRVAANSVTLRAGASIGAPAAAIGTAATSLTLAAVGDVYVGNSRMLTALDITHAHTTPGASNQISLSSPYLDFSITDDGSRYTLSRLVGANLNTLRFSGDQGIVAGTIKAAGSVTLQAGAGDILDDGQSQTRITGSSVTLSAAAGKLGTASAALGVATSNLSATTQGDLYAHSITDLAQLTIDSRHADAASTSILQITAPSLKAVLTDTAGGLVVGSFTDVTSLNLNLKSDRDITLGAVDLTSSGTARFESTTGAITDDGLKSTAVLANSVTLAAVGALGAGGGAHLDVATSTLNASGSRIDINLQRPYGSSNTTHVTALGTVSSTGDVTIAADRGDLRVGNLNAGGNVALTVRDGAMPVSMSGAVNATGTVALNATGDIGTAGATLTVTGSEVTAASSNGSVRFNTNGSTRVADVHTAGGDITIASSGQLAVGTLNAGSGTLTLSSGVSSGSIVGITPGGATLTGQKLVLSSATGAVGSLDAPLAINAPDVAVTARGQIGLANALAFTRLAIDRTSVAGNDFGTLVTGANLAAFSMTESSAGYRLDALTATSPLAFSYSGVRGIGIGHVDNAGGSVSLTSTGGSLTADAGGAANIRATSVSLAAGSSQSIGTATDAVRVDGAASLSLSAGRDIHADSATALQALAIHNTNTSGTAGQFGITAAGQTVALADDGTDVTLSVGGANTLQSFGYSGTASRNLVVGAVAASGDVTLSVAGSGAQGSLRSDGGSGRITAGSVTLTASGTDSSATAGQIGASGTALRTTASQLAIEAKGDVRVDNGGQALDSLTLALSHKAADAAPSTYSLTGLGGGSFSLTDGSTQSLGFISNGADFRLTTDRALATSTINVGAAGSVALETQGSGAYLGGSSYQAASINRLSGSITAGSVSLSAKGYNAHVGNSATLSTATQSLTVATGGNVSISNSSTLSSLGLDLTHNISGTNTNSYSLSSNGGFTFSVTDSTGTSGLSLNSVSQSGLAFSLKADRTITAASVNMGPGSVKLESHTIRSNGGTSIIADELTLAGGSVYGSDGTVALGTTVNKLNTQLTQSLKLSNTGALALGSNAVGSSADITAAGNITQAGGRFVAPSLSLRSSNGSLGAPGAELLTQSRQLTLSAGGSIRADNSVDLFSLTVDARAPNATPTTLAITAAGLDWSVTDTGTAYRLDRVVDASGLDFSFTGNRAIELGALDVQPGRNLTVSAAGSAGLDITRGAAGDALLRAGKVNLLATGSIGTNAMHMLTEAASLALTTGANAYVDNTLDLSALSLTSTQTAGAGTYQVGATGLVFDVVDNGTTTTVNQVADGTGLNFTLDTQHAQEIRVIDTTAAGTVTLRGANGMAGSTDVGHPGRITAAAVTMHTTGGAANLGNDTVITAPQLTLTLAGSADLVSDVLLESISLETTGSSARTIGIAAAGGLAFSGVDNGSTTTLSLAEGQHNGLALNVTSSRGLVLGDIDTGIAGQVSLHARSGSIVDDGDGATRIDAATLSLSTQSGGIGSGGLAIDAQAGRVTASAQGGALGLALRDTAAISSLSATGGIAVSNLGGDIAMGSVDAKGQAFSFDNQGGSLLSGSISNATSVTLSAQGSIGSDSTLQIYPQSSGTVTLTASAAAANGARGSIDISAGYALNAASVTAAGDVKLSSGSQSNLTFGTITTAGKVTLSSAAGIYGNSVGNLITGSSVSLLTAYTSAAGGSIGTSGTRVRVNTSDLTLQSRNDLYITGLADLDSLSIARGQYATYTSNGTLSVNASNLTMSATDNGTTTLTNLVDSTGLKFSYVTNGDVAVGNVNVGSSGTVALTASGGSGSRSIAATSGSSLITADSVTLATSGSAGAIGSAGTALGLATAHVTASTGSGGLYLKQAGSAELSNLSTTGALSFTASSGDITLGSLSYGSNSALTLTATNGRILAGGSGGVITGNGAVTLTAGQGIGTELAPILFGTRSKAAGAQAVTASVTGTGDVHVVGTGDFTGGLDVSTHDGAINVRTAGALSLLGAHSDADALGREITVVAGGNLTVGEVTAGTTAGRVSLTSTGGSINWEAGSHQLTAFAVDLYGATGVGTSGNRMGAEAQRLSVGSAGSIYLQTVDGTALTRAYSTTGTIDIAGSGDLLLGSLSTSGGNIQVATTGAGSDIIAGQIDAQGGRVTLNAGGQLLDDGDVRTRVNGGDLRLTAGQGIGAAGAALQTRAAAITAEVTGAGALVLANDLAGPVTLASLKTANGAIDVHTAGDTTVTSAVSTTSHADNDIGITSGGALVVGQVDAKALGGVSLSAQGAITAASNSALVRGASASLVSTTGIGAEVNGSVQALRTDVAAFDRLAATAAGSLVAIDNVGTGTLVLGSNTVDVGAGSSLSLSTAGALDASAGIAPVLEHLSLAAAGTLTVPAGGLSATQTLSLSGGDVVAAGATPRALTLQAGAITLRSGAAGGDLRLDTTTTSLDAALTGAGALMVDNTGTLASATLATANGDIEAGSSAGLTATSVTAGGTNRTVTLAAAGGDLTAGAIDAGATGRIVLQAAGSLLTADGGTLNAAALDLTSATAIGSAASAFQVTAGRVAAQVTGAGDIHLASAGALTLDRIATHNGSITAEAAGDLTGAAAISAGHGGSVTLASQRGGVTLQHALATSGDLAVTGTQIAVGDVTTGGAQRFTGTTTLTGNLAGTAIVVDGDLILAGADRLLDTRSGSGGVQVNGTLDGGGHAATLRAGSGDVALAGAAGQLAGLTIEGRQITLADVGTSGAQYYTGATVLAGQYTTGGGAFTVDGTATLAKDVRIDAGNGALRLAGNVSGAQALDLRSSGGARLDGSVDIAALQAGGGTLALNGGSVRTTGAQTYGGAVVLGADTVLEAGGDVRIEAGASGAHALAINTAGDTRLDGTLTLGAITTDAPGTLHLAGGRITTTGAQAYGERVVLDADTVLAGASVGLEAGVDGGRRALQTTGATRLGGTVAAGALTIDGGTTLVTDTTVSAGRVDFRGTIGGAQALVVNSDGATRFGGAVNVASVTTDAAGTLALDGGRITTTGAQRFGERAAIGADVVLTGSSVLLAQGAQGTASLAIDGAADIGGTLDLGALSITGSSALRTDSIRTSGGQHFGGDVEAAGALTLSAGGAVDFGAAFRADSLALVSGDTATFRGPVTLQGQGGLQAEARSLRFEGAVTAMLGAVSVTSTDAASGVVHFGGPVQAATGLVQQGGSRVELPASIQVARGAIRLDAPATLPAGLATISTDGDITMAGLAGAQTALTMAAGTGVIRIGSAGGDAGHVLNVASLAVPTAASAQLHGTINGRGGAFAASMIDSLLVGSPWYMNGTPWGPLDTVTRLATVIVPNAVVPSTPDAAALFRGVTERAALTPDVLAVFRAPQVLSIAGASNLLSHDESQSSREPAATAEASPPPAAPAGAR
ncbi:filamentous hemagglutinin N-terminal domain-containing protein [Aquincola sp. MAHUQ-54]|uniref:Filamentous hemagglutinin N-terminal domain-containing protein n=1 Tax=Aquincola agrisoli TaxID=3119538 RepID=A0AAW9QDH7_9BURK